MLSAAMPFKHESGNVLAQALHQVRSEPRSLAALRPDLPAELTSVIMAALGRNPGERPELGAIAAALDRFAAQWSEPAWPPPSVSEGDLAFDDTAWSGRPRFSTAAKTRDERERAPDASGTLATVAAEDGSDDGAGEVNEG
jgi:hypothetical protein